MHYLSLNKTGGETDSYFYENRFQERGDERCKICIVVIKTVAALDTRSQADKLYLHEGCVFCFLNPTISDQFRSEWAWDLNVS